MMRLLYVISFILLLLNSINAQQLPEQWVRNYQAQGKASDRIAAIVTDVNENVYVAGHAGNHHGAADAFVMKRNPQGDTLWTYYYDGGENEDDFAVDIVVDNVGNTYITGNSKQSAGTFEECFTSKIFPSGDEEWVMRYSQGVNTQSFGNALAVDATGNVYVAGHTRTFPGSSNWLVIKYNASGVLQWVNVWNGPDNGDDEAMDIALSANGNPTVCGFVYSLNSTGGINSFVKQYSPGGVTVWSDSWTNPTLTGSDKAYGLAFHSSGDLLVGGETTNINSTNKDAFALRYDNSGNRLWTSIYTDSNTLSDEYLRQVIVDDSGNIYFTGTDYQDGYVTRINSDSTAGWRKEWKGPLTNGNDVFHAITVDTAGNVYATGRGVYPGEDHYGNGGKTNMIIAKYNSLGDSLWTYRCLDTLNSSMGFAITSRNGKIFAGGFTTDTAYINENLYSIIIDSSGNSINEWIFNGIGDAITLGQFVQTDANNNVYCAATIDRLYANGTDVALVKYNSSGDLLWEKYFSSYGWHNDTLTGMQIDPSGNIILSISSDSALLKTNYFISLLKVNATGEFIDTGWFNNSQAGSLLSNSMDIRSDGSIALAVHSSVNGGMLVYFDSSLNLVWYVKIDTTQFAITKTNSLRFLPSGDLVVGGNSQVGSDIFGLIKKYDAFGNIIWTSIIDSAGVYDEIRDINVNDIGDIAFTGFAGGASTYYTIVGKVNGLNGLLIWQQIYNPATSREHGVKARFTNSGNIAFICRGWTGSVARYYTGQYSGTGSFQWASIYNFTASDREPVDLLIDSNNRVITAGWEINGFSTNYDYSLVGYDAGGVPEFVNNYSDSLPVSSSWDQLYDLTMDSDGNFIVTGKSAREFYNNFLYKMVTIKYGGIVLEVKTNVDELKKTIKVYPNPSLSGIFTIVSELQRDFTSASIFNLQGQLHKKFKGSLHQIDLRGYKPGVYFLILSSEGFPDENIKLIKN